MNQTSRNKTVQYLKLGVCSVIAVNKGPVSSKKQRVGRLTVTLKLESLVRDASR